MFLGFLVLIAAALGTFTYQIHQQIKREYRKATEEPLVDLSRLLSTLVHPSTSGAGLDLEILDRTTRALSQPFPAARIYEFTKGATDLSVYVTDQSGKVLYHSSDPQKVGADFSSWADVHSALQGSSGSRTTRLETDPETSAFYIATPIVFDGTQLGVLSVGKSAKAVNAFVASAQRNLLLSGSLLGLALSFCAWFLGDSIVRPLAEVSRYARSLSSLRATPPPPVSSLPEAVSLGRTIYQLKGELDDKRYIENYIQTLTHELKTPIFAVLGAAEILSGRLTSETDQAFVRNIEIEAQRLANTVDQLLVLARLERAPLANVEDLELRPLIESVISEFSGALGTKELSTKLTGRESVIARIPPELLDIALSNLLKNSVDFADLGSVIEVRYHTEGSMVAISIFNRGPHIPDYALNRIFEKFYSLPRPDSHRKSSGLGLSIAAESAAMLGGTLTVQNKEHGVEATLVFPSNRTLEHVRAATIRDNI